MALVKKTKQPDEVIDYPVDFGEWLEVRPGYSIDSYTIEVDDDDLTVVTHLKTGNIITPFLGGGVSGTTYKITVTATMAPEPLIKEYDFQVKVAEL